MADPIKSPTSARPGALNAPVPGEDAAKAAAAFMQGQKVQSVNVPEAQAAPAAVSSGQAQTPEQAAAAFMQQSQPAGGPSSWYDVSAQGLGQGALNALPAIGGIAGAGLGVVGGPLGIVGGAAAGGVAGASLKDFLQQAIFGNGPQTRGELYGGAAKEGLNQAEGAMIGESIPGIVQATKGLAPKAIAKIGNMLAGVPEAATGSYIEAPEAVKAMATSSNGDLATAADNIRKDTTQAISEAKGNMEDPALQIMKARATSASDAQVGDNVKQLISQDVEKRYAPFAKAYQQLDQIQQAAPLADKAREKFGNELTQWALDEFPQSSESWRLVKKYQTSFDASNNGLQFKNAMGDLSDEITTAFRSGETKKANLLLNIQSRAQNFMDSQIEGLAKRIGSGAATPEEMQFLQQMRGTSSEWINDPEGYGKQLAKDFFDNRDKVKADYAGFKDFMDSLTGQTKIKNTGTMNFLGKLQDIPSEKLVSNMFNEQNTAALAKMKQETPQVFEQLAQLRVKQLMEASILKDKGLDATKFYENVRELSPEVRNLLFSAEEQKTFAQVASNPKLMRLNELTDQIDQRLIKPDTNHNSLIAAGTRDASNNRGLRDLGELSLLTGKNLVSPAQTLGAMEHFGKMKLSRDALLKASIDLAQGLTKVAPSLPQSPGGQQILGQAATPAVNAVGNGIGSVFGVRH